jgi:hypothetical protein
LHPSEGYVRAAVRSSDDKTGEGAPSNNWSLPIRRNVTDGTVAWAAAAGGEEVTRKVEVSMEPLRGKLVTVDLLFADATVYAFGFADNRG